MAEKEYIEREAMIQRLKNTSLFSNFNTGGIFLRDGVIDLVEKQPAADVVEVVRCKDCKHWKAMDNGIDWHNKGRTDGTCKMLCEMHYAECCLTTENHFCSYGERKEK